jgi:molybdopterin converting factor small subunit
VEVEVAVFAGLRRKIRRGRGGPFSVALEERADIAGLLRTLGIAPRLTKIIMVNGRHAGLQKRLREGDHVDIFPPVAGG